MKSPSVILTRILGNALPPLHSREQTLINTRFILENESAWQNFQKTWVLNRIIDIEQKLELIDLLRQYKQVFVDLPFNLEAYRRVEFDYKYLPRPDFFSSERAVAFSARDLQIAYCACLHEKNRYLMNNNGARNFALSAWRGKADWCLPWDGNCFLTDDACKALLQTFQRCDYEKYVIVPMHRCDNNAAILESGFMPCPLEEPQIAFRNDSLEFFDEDFVYGFKSKVSLLRKLGVPGKWDAFPALYPWREVYEPSGKDSHLHLWGSYVLRLAADSSSPVLDYTARGVTRERAIVRFIREADYKFRLRNVNMNGLLLLNERKLEMARSSNDPRFRDLRRVVLTEADSLPRSQKSQLLQGDDLLKQGLHCQQKIVVYALAFAIRAEATYGESGVEIVRRWLTAVSADAGWTKVFQFYTLTDASKKRATPCTVARGMQFLPLVLDAIKLTRSSAAWSEEDSLRLDSAIDVLRRQLKNDSEARRAMTSDDGRGVAFDLHSAALAIFVGDRDDLYEHLMRAVGRLTAFIKRHETQSLSCGDPDEFARLLTSMTVWGFFNTLIFRFAGENLIDKKVNTQSGLRTLRDVFARLVQENNDCFENAFRSELGRLQYYFNCTNIESKRKSNIRSRQSESSYDLYEAIDQLVT